MRVKIYRIVMLPVVYGCYGWVIGCFEYKNELSGTLKGKESVRKKHSPCGLSYRLIGKLYM
jgi:glycerol-3-phosphate O-acyltransferase